MVGKIVAAKSKIDSTGGKIFIEGELWNAVSETPIDEGKNVEVVSIQGLTLKVKPR